MEHIANRNELAKLFTGTGAEIGVYRGDFSAVICQYATKLYCVDAYKAYTNHKQEDLDEACKQAMEKLPNAKFIRESSMDAMRSFKDGVLDFVYIDANHDWQHVTQDIYWWARKVRKGGIVAGHDYFVSGWDKSVMHVVSAVDGYVKAYKKKLFVTGEKKPSWWFVK